MTEYLTFLALAALLAVAPGPDSLLTLRATVSGGRYRGTYTAIGVVCAGAVQGVLAASGLGALIVHAGPVFQAIRWAGVVYLAILGVQAIRAAMHTPELLADLAERPSGRRSRTTAMAQGFLCNITNPKVLVFNIAVLPQFVGKDASFGQLLAYALTLTAVGAVVLALIVGVASVARRVWARKRVRQSVEAGTGIVMLGFAGALALDH